MAIQVKVGAGESFIEHRQINARLEALGLKLNPDNTIDEASAKNIKGGLEAIQALATDGVINSDAIAQLRRQTSLIGRVTGKDMPISEKQNKAWKALVMDLNGAANVMRSVDREISRSGTLNNSVFHRVGERIDKLQERMDKLQALDPDTAKLAQTSPGVLRNVAEAAKELGTAATKFHSTCSVFRSAMLEKLEEANGPKYRVEVGAGGYQVHERPGWWSRTGTNALASSLASALNGLPTFATLGDLFSKPIGSSATFAVRQAQAAQRGTTGGAAVAQSIIDKLGSDPGIFPGAVGPKTAHRVDDRDKPTYQAVLHAAAQDMVGRRQVANAYGNSHTAKETPDLKETEQAVPRDVFKGALAKTEQTLAAVLKGLGDKPKADQVGTAAKKQLGAEAYYAPAVVAMYQASTTESGALASNAIGASAKLAAVGSPAAQQGAAIAKSIVDTLGSDPIICPGAVGPKTVERFDDNAKPTYQAVLRAAAEDMVGRRQVANAYGNSHTAKDEPDLKEAERAVPRDVFKGALEKTQLTLATVLEGLGDKPTAEQIETAAKKQLGAEAHYAPAVVTMYQAALSD